MWTCQYCGCVYEELYQLDYHKNFCRNLIPIQDMINKGVWKNEET